jgi:hypothetical protein
MADIGTLTPEQMLQQQQILRQQKMAEMLMQQGMQQPQGQMISGRYVAPSFTQYASGLANTYVGKEGIEKADQAQIDLARQLRADETSAMTDFIQQKQGRPAIAGTPDIPTETYETVRGTPAQAAILPNPQAAYANLLANPKASSRLQNMAFNKMIADPEAFTLAEGAKRFMTMPDGSVKEVATGNQKLPATLDVAASLIPNLPKDSSKWTPEQARQVENKVMQLEAAKASVTHVNLPSEGERKAGFMSNILDRNILQMQTALGIDPKAVKPNVPSSIVEAVTGPNLLTRSMTPAQRQIVEDSQLDVLDAALTLRTGAAYTPVQLNAMRATYFPVLGDKPPAVAAKKQRLETLLEGAFIAAGRATPSRISSPPVLPPQAPNINKELNVPSVNTPKFLGFENANR